MGDGGLFRSRYQGYRRQLKQIVHLIHQGYGLQLKQIAYLTDAYSCQYSCSVVALFTSSEITLFDVVPF